MKLAVHTPVWQPETAPVKLDTKIEGSRMVGSGGGLTSRDEPIPHDMVKALLTRTCH
jgi:hypothetical protein